MCRCAHASYVATLSHGLTRLSREINAFADEPDVQVRALDIMSRQRPLSAMFMSVKRAVVFITLFQFNMTTGTPLSTVASNSPTPPTVFSKTYSASVSAIVL